MRVSWSTIRERVDEHPRLAAARHRVAAAHAAVDAAGAVPNPSVEATVGHGQAIDRSESRVEWGVGLSIPLGWLSQRGHRMDAADATARAAQLDAGALRRAVLLQLRLLFWDLVYEQERVAALTELSAQTAAIAAAVGRRVEKGEVRPVEATRVEVEAEKVAGELDAARSALTSRRSSLALWLGFAPGRELVAVADLSELPVPMAAVEAAEKVREHPVVVAGRARIEALSSTVAMERGARVPALEIGGFADHELDRRAYGVGLTIDLPVWNWNTGNVDRAEAMLSAGRRQLEAERIEVEVAAVVAQADCEGGVALAARFRDRVLPRAQSAAQTIERTYQLGEASLLEVIDARRSLLDTRRQFLAALVRAQTACSQLSALVGGELP